MLTELAKTVTADGDTVTLFQTDEGFGTAYGSPEPAAFDGHRRRYVFSVEGKGASGWGAVGAGVEWEIPGRRYASIEPWEPGAVAMLEPWADADPFGDADTYSPVTIRGAVYKFGYAWKRHPAEHRAKLGEWHISHAGLMRTNGEVTTAGRARLHHILTAARDLFLSLPDVERETARRALVGARNRLEGEAAEATKRAAALATKLDQL